MNNKITLMVKEPKGKWTVENDDDMKKKDNEKVSVNWNVSWYLYEKKYYYFNKQNSFKFFKP